MADDIVLTRSGLKKIEDEIEQLRSIEMPALAERIRQARDLGDLSENFDYQDAKRQQGFVVGKIKDLEMLLDRALVVEESEPGSELVGLGSTVSLRDDEYGDEFSYTIVGAYEADPANDKISSSSPIGQALVGKRVGEKINVTTPAGKAVYEVLAIA